MTNTPEHLHIVCSQCDSVNRVKVDRIGDHPTCAKCKKRLFMGGSVSLNENNFDKQITRNDVSMVVDFWAAWCSPCKMMAPAFEQAAAELEPFVRFGKLNTEEAQSIAARYKISSIPTILIFNHGKEMARQSGAMNRDQLVRWVQSHTRG